MDLVVPPGESPIDLPDIRLDSLAWVKMLGGPAAEIEATDLEGKPFKLADYRGKVVVLALRSGMEEPDHLESIRELIAIHERFKGQPLEIVLHDTSLASLAALRKTLRARLRPDRRRDADPLSPRPGANRQEYQEFRAPCR